MNATIIFKKSNYSNGGFEYTAKVETREQANEIAARFPKSCRVWATTHTSAEGDVSGIVIFRVLDASTSKGMGEMNEAGAARLKSFLKHVEKIGATA